ncbi:MAG TPA: TQO small subunit DoxD, partial [Acidimicrobiales bacterium]|nr:TQO small subunit DoxD [Acidimicrobiales bacterium]
MTRNWALVPLRVFLGVTFAFAGLQKLANPDFFRSSSPISIQSQLLGAARHSPIHPVLTALGHVAVLVGVLLALGELAVGLGTLAGLHARVAAVGGLLISLGLFLSVSFHSSPYYTGSDIVFLFAWTPLLVAGPGPFSADALLAGRAGRGTGAASAGTGADMERRTLLLRAGATAALGAAGAVAAGLAAGIGRLVGGTPSRAPASLAAGTAPPPTAATTTTTAQPPGPPSGSASPSTAPPTTQAPRPPGT